MNEINDHNLDLNLLRVFEAIYTERHITRAAETLGMTQSAVSHALQRMRDALDDQLFIRSKNGVEPTARAVEIAAPLKDALAQINQTISRPAAFDPMTSNRVFHFGMPDHAVAKYAPKILQHYSENAPHMSLRLHNRPFEVLVEMIEQQKLDMAASVCPELPKRFRASPIFTSRHVVVASKNHPTIQGALSVDDYIQARHVIYSVTGGTDTEADRFLAKSGLERNIALTISSHLATPIIVADSDLIATVTRELIDPFLDRYELQLFEPPFPIPDIEVSLFWHQRNDRDPAHQWMRDLTRDLTRYEV